MDANLVAVAALLVILAVIVWFDWYCLRDLARADEVYYLPRGAWAILVIAVFTLGGFAYLLVGKGPQPRRYV